MTKYLWGSRLDFECDGVSIGIRYGEGAFDMGGEGSWCETLSPLFVIVI